MPISVNNYYAKTRNGVFISKRGKAFRNEVFLAVNEQLGGFSALTEQLEVTVILAMPDRRKRDVDNYMKSLLDAMTHAGVWEDDSQIDQLLIYRAAIIKGGKAFVQIRNANPVLKFENLSKLAENDAL